MFCENCGARLPSCATFCPQCGAGVKASALPQDAAVHPPRARGKHRKSALLLVVSILLLLLGIGHMALAFAGKTTVAQVTCCQQVLFLNNDDSTRNPGRYKLSYVFSANGERYVGSVTKVFDGGSQFRQTLPVRYLPLWPHVNTGDTGKIDLTGPAVTGFGALLFVLAIKRPFRGK